MLQRTHTDPWVHRIQTNPRLISSVMSRFCEYDLDAVGDFVAAGPENASSAPHEGFKEHEVSITRILTGSDAYSVVPDELDQDYMDENLVRRTYSETAPIFDSVADKHFPPVPRSLVQEWLGVLPEDRILEIGVATGANLPCYPACHELVGIDISENSVEIARARAAELASSVRVELMNAEQMEFGNASFDKVAVLCGLCAASNPLRILKETRRVLRTGGRLVVYEPSLSHDPGLDLLLYLLQPIGRELGAVWFDGFPPRTIPYNTYWDLTAMLGVAGFSVARTKYFDPPYNSLRMIEALAG